MWWLIVIMFGNAPVMEHIEFENEKACLSAAETTFNSMQIWYQEQTQRGEDRVAIFCVKKRA